MKQHDTIIESLKQADESFQCQPLSGPAAISKAVHARLVRRKQIRRSSAVISLVLIAGCLMTYSRITQKKQAVREMAYIQAQSQRLIEQSQMLASIATSLNAEFESRKEINQLRDELASINRTLKGYQRQQDMIVFKLLYKADSLAKDKGSMPQAVEVYNNMLKYFPESKHTETARQRLEQIEIKKTELNRV
jgi:uncharacterized protein HemX